jgi:ABC-type dipeptide/oligopeptide/nickel transport system permease subunit
MEQTLFTYLKGVAFLVALILLLYPLILLFQMVTGTVTETLGQIVVLSLLSILAWAWVIRLYRNADLSEVKMKATE